MRSESSSTRRRLGDIKRQIEPVHEFVTGLDYEAFIDDTLRFYAVTRCLEIISEASRRLPAELTGRHHTVAWKEMAGAGNVYRHDYEDVGAPEVWIVITQHLPNLRIVVEAELAALGPDGPPPAT